MTRILHYCNYGGSREYVVFTDVIGIDPEEYRLNNVDLISDVVIDEEMPDGFPLGYRFHRQ